MEFYRYSRHRWPAVVLVVVLVLLAVIAFWLWQRVSQPPPPSPPQTTSTRLPPPTSPTAQTELPPPPHPKAGPSIEDARKALREGVDPTGAVEMARPWLDKPESADGAFLLLEYAAEEGNAEAALAVGRFYDPLYQGPSGSIRKDPALAYEWYTKALNGGQAPAQKRLVELRGWVEEQATGGSRVARQLLDSWQKSTAGEGR